mmetsp:Transcript_50257/g.92862  ORF Transcript_50257/g.92862 Transcript_50257/m.92862 type:complete len:216 (+) Transcript_50257:88-735(+)
MWYGAAVLMLLPALAQGRFLHSSPAAGANSTAVVPDDAAKLSALHASLSKLQALKSVFANEHANEPQAHAPDAVNQASQFADGALSQELSKSDSNVWATIDAMIGTTKMAAQEMKGKGKEEQKKVMASLERTLDDKAGQLSSLTDKVNAKQRKLDEEYVLGLLLMHQKDWDMKEQLNATATFMHSSPVLQELYEHHDANQALAPQLAKLMDSSRK